MSARRFLPLIFVFSLALPFMVGARGSRKDRSVARAELGRAYLAEGSLESAIGTLKEAIDLDHSNWVAWNFLGLALAEKGKPEDAIKALETSIRHADGRAEPHLNYGLILFSQGQVEPAIAQYELALDDLTYRKPAYVLNNLGYALISKGDNDRAVTVLREAVNRAPNLCPARFNLGIALQESGKARDAIKEFSDVISTCGEEVPGAYLQIARLEIEQGRTDQAASYLEQVLAMAPDTEVSDAARALLVTLEP